MECDSDISIEVFSEKIVFCDRTTIVWEPYGKACVRLMSTVSWKQTVLSRAVVQRVFISPLMNMAVSGITLASALRT